MKQKRRWSWTEKELRKTRSYKCNTWERSPKRWFVRMYNKFEKTKLKEELHLFITKDKPFDYKTSRTGRNRATWHWQ